MMSPVLPAVLQIKGNSLSVERVLRNCLKMTALVEESGLVKDPTEQDKLGLLTEDLETMLSKIER